VDVKIDIPWSLFDEAASRAASRSVRIIAFELKDMSARIIRGGVAAHVRKTKVGGKWVIETVTDLIDTGALLNSGYVMTGTGLNERPQAISAASSRQPGIAFGTPDRTPQGELEARFAYAAEYAPYVEAMYPFLGPAVPRVRAKVDTIVAAEMRKEGL